MAVLGQPKGPGVRYPLLLSHTGQGRGPQQKPHRCMLGGAWVQHKTPAMSVLRVGHGSGGTDMPGAGLTAHPIVIHSGDRAGGLGQ